MPLSDVLLALLVQVLWGMNFVAAKVGVDNLPPLLFTGLRFAIAGALVVPFFPMPRGRALLGVLALSFTFGTVHFGVQFMALRHVDAANAAVILQTGVPFTTLLGVLLLGETIRWRRILGMVLAFSGVVVIAGEPHMGAIGPLLMLLAAAFAWAVSNVIVKTTQGVPPLAVTGWLCLFAMPQAALLSWLLEDGHWAAVSAAPWQAWAGLAYTAVVTSLVAHSIWYMLMRRHPIGVVAPWGLVAPVIGLAAGILNLGEAATWQKLLGGAITLTGVAIIQVRQIRRGRPVIGAANPEATRDPVPTLSDVPSPNHDARPPGVVPDMLVLHYTGMPTGAAALDRMRDPEAKVSAHYLVEEDGRILRLVPETRRAWHAGVSAWRGHGDVNARSIGVEIVNPGHEFGYRPFPDAQMAAVVALCRDIVDRHPILPGNVVAHADIAPTRKEDPGELFDWPRLADAGVGLWPQVDKRAPAPTETEALAALGAIGYDLTHAHATVTAFQRRYRPARLDGLMDEETARLTVAVLRAGREAEAGR